MNNKHKIVIIGGGFAGLHAARELRHADAQVTLIDRCNYHLFQPLLYQAATGALSPANISAPLRSVLKRQSNARVLLGEVVDFDLDAGQVLLSDGSVHYDSLIVAAGARNCYFGNEERWQPLAPGLKSLADAIDIRRRVLVAFEKAERIALDPGPLSQSEQHRLVADLLTFVIIGGGPTGVELAGSLAELAEDTLRKDFRGIHPDKAQIHLIEHGSRLVSMFHERLSQKTHDALTRLGVQIQTGTRVEQIHPDHIVYSNDEGEKTIRTSTVLWAAGVSASPLGGRLAERASIETDRHGRVPVDEYLRVAGQNNVYVVGDIALREGVDGRPLPGTAPVAIQQGQYAARTIARTLREKPVRPFRFSDRGMMATIGRMKAIAQVGRMRISGLFAWFVWLFIHLLYLVGFEKRMLVLIQWAGNFLTWNRTARLITGDHILPLLSLQEEEGKEEDVEYGKDSGKVPEEEGSKVLA